jgi:hypothetical protein
VAAPAAFLPYEAVWQGDRRDVIPCTAADAHGVPDTLAEIDCNLIGAPVGPDPGGAERARRAGGQEALKRSMRAEFF